MEWIRCSCGNEEFKISKLGVAYCARCMKPLEIELKIPGRAPEPRLPEPKRDLLPHPDVPGYLRIRNEVCETSFRGGRAELVKGADLEMQIGDIP